MKNRVLKPCFFICFYKALKRPYKARALSKHFQKTLYGIHEGSRKALERLLRPIFKMILGAVLRNLGGVLRPYLGYKGLVLVRKALFSLESIGVLMVKLFFFRCSINFLRCFSF